MPEQTAPPTTELQIPSPTVVTPAPDSRLDQLTAEFAMLKPQVETMKERLETLTKALKTELSTAAPEGSTDIVLRSPHLPLPYRLHPVESWRIDAKKLKETDPETYVRWAKKSTAWRLEQVK